MKQHSAELFRVSPISQLHELLKMQMQYMLPNRDSNGRQIYIFRVGMLAIFLNIFTEGTYS